MNKGIYLDMPRAEYDAIDAVNNSSIQHARRSMRRMAWAMGGGRSGTTTALEFGTLVHSVVLKGETWNACSHRRGSANWKSIEETSKAQGRRLCTNADGATVLDIQAAVSQHETASELLSAGGNTEVVAVGELCGVPCKCRADFVQEGAPVIVDLKTTQDCSPHAFAGSIGRYGYARQAAFYTDLFGAVTGVEHEFAIIAAEKSAPYEVRVYTLTDETMDAGRAEYTRVLRLWKDRVEEADDVEEIGMSRGWIEASIGDEWEEDHAC